MYYDKDGSPLTLEEWGIKHSNFEYKGIGNDYVGDYRVSTVWLGMNHAYNDEAPLIFETMVFLKDTFDDVWCQRYSTEQEAIQGHKDLVESITQGKEISYDNQ